MAAADLAEGTMHRAEIGDEAVLLARLDGTVRAIGATCPHAGAPLDEGVLCGDTVVCPWHKAAFRFADGRCAEPPAVDDLPCHTVREASGRILVTLAAPPAPAPVSVDAEAGCMAVIGAGGAGAVAAQTLRACGYRGRVVLIDRDGMLPADRTILSKYALSGEEAGEKSPLQVAGFYDRQAIERIAGDVTDVDPAARRIRLGGGQTLTYTAALLATGGMPKRLAVPGSDLPGVHTLRTAHDVAAILRDAEGARHVVVIGSGFIGLEAAGSLRERGLAVTVVAPEKTPLERPLGPEVGAALQRIHERQGVVFRLGEEVTACEGGAKVSGVTLRSGTTLPADLVITGLGITPATAPLRLPTRRGDGGIDVDAHLRVTDGLYAAGDIAAFPLGGDGERVRVEHWRVAQQHGRVAARNMLGQGVSYDAVPYFWTIHYKQALDYVGHAGSWDEVAIDGDLEKPDFCAFYLEGGVVRALAAWGRERQMAAAVGFLQQRRDWTRPALHAALAAV